MHQIVIDQSFNREFFILVHRYEVPEDAWGLHKFTPDPKIGQMHSRPFGISPDDRRNGNSPVYAHETIGLFRTERKDELIKGLIEVEVPAAIQYFVYTQVVPIEWQGQIREPGNRLQNMVTMLVHE